MRHPTRARHELKYTIGLKTAAELFSELGPFCDPDPHAGPEGKYEVASIYYDTRDLRFYWDRQESVGYRRKVRLRSYNQDFGTLGYFLEIKEKHRSFVAKKRVALDPSTITLSSREDLTPLESVLSSAPDKEATREVAYLHNRLNLLPVSIIRYIRRTLVGKTERDLRITFDHRITTGGQLFHGFDAEKEVFVHPPREGILEVKTNQSLPLWLLTILQSKGLTQTRFSKYCLGVDALFGKYPRMLRADDERSGVEAGDAAKLAQVG